MRLFAAIRFDEVLVLQGAPVMGALLAGHVSAAGFRLLLLGNAFLVAHVFALNDYSGLEHDAKDSARGLRGLAASELSRASMQRFIIILLALALAALALLGFAPFFIGSFVAMMSALYSAPFFHWKGIPVANSALHICGGAAHFLLGYASFAPLDMRGLTISIFFGVVFAAGHLTHEASDHAADFGNNIRTNAVHFGPRAAFLGGLGLFTLAYVLMGVLVLYGIMPRPMAIITALLPLHLWTSFRALNAGLTRESLLTLQWQYRAIFAFFGITAFIALATS